jgi:hypothetical protein
MAMWFWLCPKPNHPFPIVGAKCLHKFNTESVANRT